MSTLKWQQLLFRNLHLPSPTSCPQRVVSLLFPCSTSLLLYPGRLLQFLLSFSHLQWPLASLVFTRSLSFGSVLFQGAGPPLSAHRDTALGLSLCNLVPGLGGTLDRVRWGEGEGSFLLQNTQ